MATNHRDNPSARGDKPANSHDQTANLAGVDSLLVAYRQSGLPSDFEQIVKRFGALVFNECRRVTGNAHDAEDAAQLTLLAFAIELRSGMTLHRPIAWLQRVSKRQSLKIVRARGRRKRREDAVRRDIDAAAPDRDTVVDDRILTAALVRDAIDALPERYRLPLVLHYFGGMSMESIAGELGLTKTAVGTRLHRARKLVADQLDARGLSFDTGTLTRMIACVVPIAVVSNLVSSASVGSTTQSAGMAASLSLMLQASSHLTGPRAIAIAAIGLGLGGTALGWRGLPTLEQIRQKLDVTPLLDRLFEPPPLVPKLAALPQPSTGQGPEALPAYASSWSGERAFVLAEPVAVAVPSVDVRPSSSLLASAVQPPSGKSWSNPLPANPVVAPWRDQPASTPRSDYHNLPAPRAEPVRRAAPPPQASAKQRASTPHRIGTGELMKRESLVVDDRAGHHPRFVQTGGEVRLDRLLVGDRRRGKYELHAGRLETGRLTVGNRPRSRGELSVGAGEVVVTDPKTPVEIGKNGAGVVYLGTKDKPGRFSIVPSTDSKLIVRSSVQADGIVRGWGDVDSYGAIINNGRVIADGFDHLRTLNFANLNRVTNTIDNPYDGVNGWYATRGGRVVLPNIHVLPGTNTYTWGEDDDDPSIDLVNSVRFTVHEQAVATSVSINLRTVALNDPLDVTLPYDVSIFGLWEFAAAQLSPQQMSLEVRYNADAANSYIFGESALQLLAYTESGWKRADNGWIDLNGRTIGGEFLGGISYLAVAMDSAAQPVDYFAPRPLNTVERYFSFQQMVVPEPSGLALFAGAFIGGRRRRRVTAGH